MDYAFAPGTTGYDRIMRDLFAHKAGATLINQAGVRRVDQFISHLKTDSGVSRPVDNLLIGTHGNDGGWFQVQLADIDGDGDGRPDANTTYSVLEIADNTDVIRLPSTLVKAGSRILIKGCKIGQAEAFVDKLTTAFGGNVPVIAPIHFHNVWYRRGLGIIEYMSYDFSLAQPTAFPNRAALITAFKNAGLTFYNGTHIPDEKWSVWIPGGTGRGRRTRNFTVNLNPSLTPNSGRPLSSLRLSINGGFRHDLEKYTFTIGYPGSTPPTSQDARKADMRASMAALDVFKATHPFPVYKRYELDSLDAFINGFIWKFNYLPKRKIMLCNGTRHRYTVQAPVAQPNTNNLLFNFYPYSGNSTPAVSQLSETDKHFFYEGKALKSTP